MKQYLDLVRQVLEEGEVRGDRTGTGTISIFGTQTKYDLREGFPLVTTKKVPFKSVVLELLWFISGSTNIKDLGCGIWDEWADENGDIGPGYGKQWRIWDDGPDGDQIINVIDSLANNPFSRRHVVSAWNVSDLSKMKLPPCHMLFQFYVSTEGWLDCRLDQRSADLALGAPFNIASYALLMHLVAYEVNNCSKGKIEITPRHLIHQIGDTHIYLNHVEGLKEQLTRAPGALPFLELSEEFKNNNGCIFHISAEDIILKDYNPQKRIKFDVAV